MLRKPMQEVRWECDTSGRGLCALEGTYKGPKRQQSGHLVPCTQALSTPFVTEVPSVLEECYPRPPPLFKVQLGLFASAIEAPEVLA